MASNLTSEKMKRKKKSSKSDDSDSIPAEWLRNVEVPAGSEAEIAQIAAVMKEDKVEEKAEEVIIVEEGKKEKEKKKRKRKKKKDREGGDGHKRELDDKGGKPIEKTSAEFLRNLEVPAGSEAEIAQIAAVMKGDKVEEKAEEVIIVEDGKEEKEKKKKEEEDREGGDGHKREFDDKRGKPIEKAPAEWFRNVEVPAGSEAEIAQIAAVMKGDKVEEKAEEVIIVEEGKKEKGKKKRKRNKKDWEGGDGHKRELDDKPIEKTSAEERLRNVEVPAGSEAEIAQIAALMKGDKVEEKAAEVIIVEEGKKEKDKKKRKRKKKKDWEGGDGHKRELDDKRGKLIEKTSAESLRNVEVPAGGAAEIAQIAAVMKRDKVEEKAEEVIIVEEGKKEKGKKKRKKKKKKDWEGGDGHKRELDDKRGKPNEKTSAEWLRNVEVPAGSKAEIAQIAAVMKGDKVEEKAEEVIIVENGKEEKEKKKKEEEDREGVDGHKRELDDKRGKPIEKAPAEWFRNVEVPTGSETEIAQVAAVMKGDKVEEKAEEVIIVEEGKEGKEKKDREGGDGHNRELDDGLETQVALKNVKLNERAAATEEEKSEKKKKKNKDGKSKSDAASSEEKCKKRKKKKKAKGEDEAAETEEVKKSEKKVEPEKVRRRKRTRRSITC